MHLPRMRHLFLSIGYLDWCGTNRLGQLNFARQSGRYLQRMVAFIRLEIIFNRALLVIWTARSIGLYGDKAYS